MTQNILIALIPLMDSIARLGTSVEKTAFAFRAKEKQSKIWRIAASEIRNIWQLVFLTDFTENKFKFQGSVYIIFKHS